MDSIDQGLSLDFYQKEAWNTGQPLGHGKGIKTFQQELFPEGDWVHVSKIYKPRSIEFYTKMLQNRSHTERKDLMAEILEGWQKLDRNYRTFWQGRDEWNMIFNSSSITENMLAPSWFRMQWIMMPFLLSLVNLLFWRKSLHYNFSQKQFKMFLFLRIKINGCENQLPLAYSSCV